MEICCIYLEYSAGHKRASSSKVLGFGPRGNLVVPGFYKTVIEYGSNNVQNYFLKMQ